MSRSRQSPVCTFVDPRVEVYAPTSTSDYFRIRGFDEAGRRVVDTTGGSTLRKAKAKAAKIAVEMRREASHAGPMLAAMVFSS